MVTVVKSAIENKDLREKIRTIAALQGNYTNVFFLLGQRPVNMNKKSYNQIIAESNQHHDMVFGNFSDIYSNLQFKVFLGYEFFIKFCENSPALIVQDDDAIIQYAAIIRLYRTQSNDLEYTTLCLEEPVSFSVP